MFQGSLEELNWRRHRPNVALETNLARKGFVSLGSGETVDAEDLLGTTKATVALRLNDLDVLAWLSARRPFGGHGVLFSRSHIASDLYRRSPGGRERRIVEESLRRLSETRLTFRGYSPESKKLVFFEDVQILQKVERVDGSTTLAIFAPWLARHLESRYVTYLNWNSLRSLGGLAKRLWIYLEAENLSRKAKAPSWLALGDKTWTALGVDFKKPNQARAALRMAMRKIEGVDSDYLLEISGHGPSGFKLNIHLAPLRPDESQPPQAEDDDNPITFLDFEDLEWIGSETAGILMVGPTNEGSTFHRPNCNLIQGQWGQAAQDVNLILFSNSGVLTQWLLDHRLATPRRCIECRPPDVRFSSEAPRSEPAPTTSSA